MRRPGGGEEACYTLYVYEAAIKPVAPHRKHYNQKREENWLTDIFNIGGSFNLYTDGMLGGVSQ